MNLHRATRVFGYGLMFLIATATLARASASPSYLLTLEDGKHIYPVRFIQAATDPEHSLSLDQIRRLEATGKSPWVDAKKPNFGYSTSRYWLKLEIINASKEEQNWVLEFGYPLIQVLNVYQYFGDKETGAWHTGKLAPFNSRPIAHRNFLFNFTSRKGDRTVFYFMLESSGTLLAPITVYSQKEFLSRNAENSAGIGIYCGVILAMVLFNFFLLITSRDKNYLYYIGYALSFCLLMNTLNGMTYQHLWPEFPSWNNISVPILAGICYLFLAVFTRSILDTRRYAPRMNAGLYLIVIGALFLIFGGLFHYGLLVNKFTSFFISAAPLVVLPISLWCWRKRSPAAGYYSLAFAFFFLGAAVRAARDLAWIPQNLFADYGPYFGSAIEMMLLSLALAVRIRLLREEKLKSELHALEAERDLTDSRSELEKQTALASLAAQVAHDIRSPLVALDAALDDTAQLPEKQRAVVRHSLNRIRDIASDLLEKNRQQPGAASQNTGNASGLANSEVRLLSSMIDAAVTEKRLQFRTKPGISVDFKLTTESYGLFARIQPVEFGRLLSNLINNAGEALGGNGAINVGLTKNDGAVLLTVADTGKGIPQEILAKLGQRGETHGKAGGSGLGLYHARTMAESWGGGLRIASTTGKGTTVTVKLPQAQPPAGFVAALKLAPGRPIVVLDDDPGIHELWRGRFETVNVKEHNIEVFNFSEPEGLRAWIKENPEKAPKAVYLFDYELAGHAETGLSLAEELNLCNRTILITSRAEEKHIIDACAALNVRIIPKGLAGIVPISVGDNKPPSRAVLLDDSTITQMTWEIAAEEAGVKLAGYTEPDKFMADLGNLPKDMPIYIDSELGENVKGENIAAELKEKGFTNICLATAHPPERFAHLPWLKVRSKEAPWGQDDVAA